MRFINRLRMNTSNVVLASLLIVFGPLCGYASPPPPVAVTASNITGEWEKKYILQDGRDNADPRWALKVIFRPDNGFMCDSVLLKEKQLVDPKTGAQTTKAMTESAVLEGTYRLEGDKVFIKFSKDLNDTQKDVARVNFGYDDGPKEAAVNTSLEGGLLVLSNPASNRIIYLEKKNKPKQ
jgi:hypothetical protein